MPSERKGTDLELLTLRFDGQGVASRSMPIYELASSLIAVQRIIHKAALFSEGNLERGVRLPTQRRRELALQIYAHREGSDVWGLAPYLTNPAIGPIFQQLIAIGVTALSAYVWKRIRSDSKTPANQALVVNIFPEVKQLVDRIDNIGGVERIELLGPQQNSVQPLVIDGSTQEYVRELEYQLVPGSRRKISGVVTKILPQSFRLDIEDAPGHYIQVVLDPERFEKLRRLSSLTDREIEFEGIPYYRLGETRGGIKQFHAERFIVRRGTE